MELAVVSYEDTQCVDIIYDSLQQTLSENNLIEVTENLTKVVAQAEDQVDQSENNLAVISQVLAEASELLNASNIPVDAKVSLYIM